MSIDKVKEIADEADVIINGYAITKCQLGFSVVNLNMNNSSAVFDFNNEMIETSMDDIELSIARDYLLKSKQFLEFNE